MIDYSAKNLERSINEITKEDWFGAKPWLVTGTGRTLDRYTADMSEAYNVWAITGSIDIVKHADIFHFQDIYAYNWFWRLFPENYRYCLIRPKFESFYTPDRAIYVHYDRDVEMPVSKDVYPLSNSTSFAFMFLAMHGVKTIHTLGIAEGKEFATGLQEGYKELESKEDFDLHNASNQSWCNIYGSKWIKL